MKLITFTQKNKQKLAAIVDDSQVIDLMRAHQQLFGKRYVHFNSLLAFIQAGETARAKAEQCITGIKNLQDESCLLPLEKLTLLAPIPRPVSIRDFMAFEDHIINCIRREGLKKLGDVDDWIEKKWGRQYTLAKKLNASFYQRPIYYKGNANSVVGTDSDVIMPQGSQRFDYELEFGIYIAKKGKNIKAEDAHEYIAGYTLFNDFSDRNIQLQEQKGRLGPAKGKDFDTGNAMGPFFVTADEMTQPENIQLQAYVNGELWSEGNSADMYWSFAQMIEYVSRDETIYPGEFFGSGTCSNMQSQGCGLEHGRFLKAGDQIELTSPQLGTLRNSIVSSQ